MSQYNVSGEYYGLGFWDVIAGIVGLFSDDGKDYIRWAENILTDSNDWLDRNVGFFNSTSSPNSTLFTNWMAHLPNNLFV
jgi:hypothetical protein